MNDFLDRVWWDNAVRDYGLILGIILFVLLLNRLISRYLAGLLYKGVSKIWKGVDKRSFINLIIQPLGNFVVILVSIIALYKLNFPAQLETEVYGYGTRKIIHAAGDLVLIIAFVSLLLRLIDFIAIVLEIKANRTPEQTDNQLILFFKDFFKVIIVIIGILLILKFAFGLRISNLLTGLSIVGAAIALALRESLENLIASFIIFFDKPFTIGDLVKVKDVTGTVERIGLRSTKIRTEEMTYLTVPNKQMVDSILDNLSLRTQRRGEIKLEISLQTDSSTLEKGIESLRGLLKREGIVESNVYLHEISNHAFIIHAEYFTSPVTVDEFSATIQEMNFLVLRKLEEMKIQFSGSIRDVRIVNPQS